ncbi:MAG: NADPH-dependent F420 reductase [Ktedonobacteraceae bacterium]
MATHTFTLAVLGAGNIGGTLGRKWQAAGHRVSFGVSDPRGKNAQTLREELGERVTIGTVDEALATNPAIIVLALPGVQMDTIITKHAALLDSRVIIDTANRLGGGPMNSFAALQKYTPHAHLFRAFNSLGWENFADPLFNGVQADLFYCGPDDKTRVQVEQLIVDIGLNPLYLGGSEQVSLVDSMGAIWFALVFGQGKGRHLAFKVLTR